MELIVDIQGFKKPINEFVLKEISFVEVNGDAEPMTLLFKPPTPWNFLPTKYKVMNSWLQRNFHGIQWNAGDVPYEALVTLIPSILERARTIYVKGLEKKTWLMKFTNVEIIDMETLDCPSLRELTKNNDCSHHYSTKYSCATENVKCLRSWCIRQK